MNSIKSLAQEEFNKKMDQFSNWKIDTIVSSYLNQNLEFSDYSPTINDALISKAQEGILINEILH